MTINCACHDPISDHIVSIELSQLRNRIAFFGVCENLQPVWTPVLGFSFLENAFPPRFCAIEGEGGKLGDGEEGFEFFARERKWNGH